MFNKIKNEVIKCESYCALCVQYSYFKAFLAFAGCNIVLATAASALCAFIAPAAAGSGIPEVKAYLNGVDAPSILAPRTLFVKVNADLRYIVMYLLKIHLTANVMFLFFFLFVCVCDCKSEDSAFALTFFLYVRTFLDDV